MSDDAPPFPKLLTTKEVCEALGIDAKTLRWHVQEGHLSYILLGSGEMRPRRRYHPDDLAAFIQARTVRGEPTVPVQRHGRRARMASLNPEEQVTMDRLTRLSRERAGRLARASTGASELPNYSFMEQLRQREAGKAGQASRGKGKRRT